MTSTLQFAPAMVEIAAGEFKAKCLQLMDEVNETGVELIITKRGKPTQAGIVDVELVNYDERAYPAE